MVNSHIDVALEKIRVIFEKVDARIQALVPGERVPATTLAKEIAEGIGMTGPALYPTIKFLLDGYPGVKILRGAHGGIEKLPLPAATDNQDPSTVAP